MIRAAMLAIALSVSFGLTVVPFSAAAAEPPAVVTTTTLPAEESSEEIDALAARDAASSDADEFRGGDHDTIYISSTVLVLVLVILVLIIIL